MTGATGCLGMSLVRLLIDSGYNIIALGRNRERGEIITGLGAQFIETDIRSPISVPELSYSFIIHCAALSTPWEHYQDFYQTNVVGTNNVINLAKKIGSALIHISTPSVYFDFRDQIDISEDSSLPDKFASYYTQTKKLAEDLVIDAQRDGMKTVILRPRAIFGPYDTGIVPRILKLAKKGVFPLIRKGEVLADITYVDNVSHAIRLSIENINSINGEILNITNDSPMQLKDILKLLFSSLNYKATFIAMPRVVLNILALFYELIGKVSFRSFEPPITRYTLGLISFSQTLDVSKAKKALGYEPIVSIEDGIKRLRQ